MARHPTRRDGDIPLFTGENFFRPNESVYIQLSSDFPDYVGVWHKHQFIEIVYVISGHAKHCVGNQSYPVQRGDLCIINFETPHTFIEEKGDEPFVTYDLMFTPSYLDSSLLLSSSFESLSSSFLFYSLFPDQQPFQPDLHLTDNNYRAFGEIFSRIYNEYHQRDQGYVDIIRAYIIELVVKLLREINSSHSMEISPHQQQMVDSAIQYLRENYNMPVTVGLLAGKVFLSKDYFGKLFHKITGDTVNSFLQKLRIDRACQLLITTALPIRDIAERCGYEDMKSFYSAFKRFENMTPGQYRQAKGGKHRDLTAP